MLAGPYATMLLADLGAEVIKIEPPGGEISRQVSDSYFASLNRNKQSVCLDLRSEAGRQQLGELVAKSHALLVNMKPSAIRRLGLTYERCGSSTRRSSVWRMTGFGMDGGDDPAFDYVIQAGTGVAAMTGDPDGAADAARLFGGRQLHRTGRGAWPAGPDRVGSRRAGRRVAARCGDVAAELPGLGLPQRRRRAAATPVRCAFVLRSGAAVPDGRRLSRAVHHPRRVLEGVRRRGRHIAASRRWPSARPSATRCSPSSTAALATDTAKGWEARLRPLGIPAAAVRTLPDALEATPEVVVTAGDFRLVGSPIHVVRLRARVPPAAADWTSTGPFSSYSTVTDSVSGTP